MKKTQGEILIEKRIAKLDPDKDSDLIRQLSSQVLACGYVQSGIPPLTNRPLTEEDKIFAGHVPALFEE